MVFSDAPSKVRCLFFDNEGVGVQWLCTHRRECVCMMWLLGIYTGGWGFVILCYFVGLKSARGLKKRKVISSWCLSCVWVWDGALF